MTIQHHPSDVILGAFTAQALDRGERMVIATHLKHCAHCRAFVRNIDPICGLMLDRVAPVPRATVRWCGSWSGSTNRRHARSVQRRPPILKKFLGCPMLCVASGSVTGSGSVPACICVLFSYRNMRQHAFFC